MGHHFGDGGSAVPAVTPSQRCISPVHSHNGFVRTFAHPEEDVIEIDGSLDRNRDNRRSIDNRLAHRIDSHRINVGIVPNATVFHAINDDTGSGLSPLFEIAVDEGLAHTGIHRPVVLAFPIAERNLTKGVALCHSKEDVIETPSTQFVAEAWVGSGDFSHHAGDSGGAVPAVTPSQRSVSPVHSHYGLVRTGTTG